MVSLNATQAAIRAKYSEKTAKEQGARLLTNVHVSAAIEKAMEKRSKKTEITQERVVVELARIAFGDLRGVVTWGPSGVAFKNSAEISDDDAAAISEVSETVTKEGGTQRIKRHDKVKALELLGKHLGMFKDQSGPVGEGKSMIGSILEALRG